MQKLAVDHQSVYHSNADVLGEIEGGQMGTFQYRLENSWRQIGKRILSAGWGPDCAVAHARYIQALPPKISIWSQNRLLRAGSYGLFQEGRSGEVGRDTRQVIWKVGGFGGPGRRSS